MSLLDALIQVESSGRRGVLGPRTKYGQAMGLTQVLPGTGAEMAQKLGVPWRPDLMTAPTDEGAEYQRLIGQAYLDQGMERTGNTRDALRYYHGGPNFRNTDDVKGRAYADRVLSLAGPEQMPPYYSQQPDPLSPMPGAPAPAQPAGLAGILAGPDYSAMSPMNANGTDPLAPKPRAFDKGGKGWVIAGIIADAIAGGFGKQGGFTPAYLAGQEDDRQRQVLRERMEAARQERMSQPYRFQNNAGDVVEIVPSNGQQRVLYADPYAKPEYARIEDPTTGAIEIRPQPNTSRPTRQHIEALISNPERAAEFDAKFGRGMAAYILGNR